MEIIWLSSNTRTLDTATQAAYLTSAFIGGKFNNKINPDLNNPNPSDLEGPLGSNCKQGVYEGTVIGINKENIYIKQKNTILLVKACLTKT